MEDAGCETRATRRDPSSRSRDVGARCVYGMYDIFMSAGRDWGMIVERKPGRPLMRRASFAPREQPIAVANGVHDPRGRDARRVPRAPDIVCVPEIYVPPGEPHRRRFRAEVEWLQALPRRRRDARDRLLGRDAAGRGRPARRPRGDDPLGLLRRHARAVSAGARARAARAGRVAAKGSGW